MKEIMSSGFGHFVVGVLAGACIVIAIIVCIRCFNITVAALFPAEATEKNASILTTIVLVAVVIGVIVLYVIAAPRKLISINGIIDNKGINSYQEYVNMSDSIRIWGDTIEVKVDDNGNDKWINIADIDDFVNSDSRTFIRIYDVKYTVNDKATIELLKTFNKVWVYNSLRGFMLGAM